MCQITHCRARAMSLLTPGWTLSSPPGESCADRRLEKACAEVRTLVVDQVLTLLEKPAWTHAEIKALRGRPEEAGFVAALRLTREHIEDEVARLNENPTAENFHRRMFLIQWRHVVVDALEGR